ncbi:MAG: hypothetical protein ACYS0C_06210 [Planctomycetota bacterium]|jgi:hypothetical protein
MKKSQHKRFAFCLFTFTFPALVFFHSGCGMVSVMGTPTRHEKKIPAEFDLAERTEQKILVLVNQPAYLNADVNLRYYLTEAMREGLMATIGIRPGDIVGYDDLSEYRSNQSNFSMLSPVAVGRALGADMVLLLVVEDYQLTKMAETDYYNGLLGAQAALLDTADGEKLWPESAESKSIRVGFEVAGGGWEAAVERLANACAHCTTRYFYDCPRGKFKIFDDKSGVDWESWK